MKYFMFTFVFFKKMNMIALYLTFMTLLIIFDVIIF